MTFEGLTGGGGEREGEREKGLFRTYGLWWSLVGLCDGLLVREVRSFFWGGWFYCVGWMNDDDEVNGVRPNGDEVELSRERSWMFILYALIKLTLNEWREWNSWQSVSLTELQDSSTYPRGKFSFYPEVNLPTLSYPVAVLTSPQAAIVSASDSTLLIISHRLNLSPNPPILIMVSRPSMHSFAYF